MPWSVVKTTESKEVGGKVTTLLNNVLLLAGYAVETGRLPEQVSWGEIYRMRVQLLQDGKALSETDVNQLAQFYTALEQDLLPVTAVSLAATDCQGIKGDRFVCNHRRRRRYLFTADCRRLGFSRRLQH